MQLLRNLYRACCLERGVTWLFAVIAIVILAVGVVVTWWQERAAQGLIREVVMGEARMIAVALDVQQISQLKGDASDLALPAFQMLQSQMRRIQAANPRYKYVYLMGRRGQGDPFFFMGSAPDDSSEYSPPGQVYFEKSPSLAQAFDTQREVFGTPFTDRWGKWVSALIPITHPQTGTLLAVFGMDLDARELYQNAIYRELVPLALTLFALIALAALALLLKVQTEQVTRRRSQAAYKLLEDVNADLEEEIAARSSAEQELKHSEARYRLLAETAQESISILDLAGRIVYANRATREILGCGEDELLGQEISRFTTPEEGKRWYGLLRERLEGKHGAMVISTELVTKDARHVPFEFTSAAVVEDGKITGVMNVGRDISDRLQAERARQQMLQAQKLEAIGTLAGGIAHDFNNILFAIIANAELMQDNISGDSPDAECLEQILQASQRAKELVRQILAFSRRSDTKPMALNISLLTKEVVKLLRPALPSSIEMRIDVSGNVALVQADPTEIHQLLMNLCTNSAHAMAGGQGLLEIGLKDVFLDQETVSAYAGLSAGDYVQLTISDSGCGMPPQIRERIFEPFFTTKEQGQGTGMGLSVVHGIVTKLGGSITVYSEEGLGTTFHIYLPALSGAAPPTVVEHDTALPRGTGNILVVDDERAITDAIARMLQALGYEVAQCNTGLHALELFNADPTHYDLVITDMTMPKMNGTALARELLTQRPDLPVILCTGFSHSVSSETASGIGICSYLAKPISRHALAHTVARLLGFTSAL